MVYLVLSVTVTVCIDMFCQIALSVPISLNLQVKLIMKRYGESLCELALDLKIVIHGWVVIPSDWVQVVLTF